MCQPSVGSTALAPALLPAPREPRRLAAAGKAGRTQRRAGVARLEAGGLCATAAPGG